MHVEAKLGYPLLKVEMAFYSPIKAIAHKFVDNSYK